MFEGARKRSKMLDAVRRHSRTVEGAYLKPFEGVRRFVICYLQTGTTDRKSSPSFRLAALADGKYSSPFRVVQGKYERFTNLGGPPTRYEWRVEFGGRRCFVHRLVLRAVHGCDPFDLDWRVDHLAGLEGAVADCECGWCLGTWESLYMETFTDEDGWSRASVRRKQRWRAKLIRYRRGRFWW